MLGAMGGKTKCLIHGAEPIVTNLTMLFRFFWIMVMGYVAKFATTTLGRHVANFEVGDMAWG
jgi:hypothetical protein